MEKMACVVIRGNILGWRVWEVQAVSCRGLLRVNGSHQWWIDSERYTVCTMLDERQ